MRRWRTVYGSTRVGVWTRVGVGALVGVGGRVGVWARVGVEVSLAAAGDAEWGLGLALPPPPPPPTAHALPPPPGSLPWLSFLFNVAAEEGLDFLRGGLPRAAPGAALKAE